jgi:hypothetical protein
VAFSPRCGAALGARGRLGDQQKPLNRIGIWRNFYDANTLRPDGVPSARVLKQYDEGTT